MIKPRAILALAVAALVAAVLFLWLQVREGSEASARVDLSTSRSVSRTTTPTPTPTPTLVVDATAPEIEESQTYPLGSITREGIAGIDPTIVRGRVTMNGAPLADFYADLNGSNPVHSTDGTFEIRYRGIGQNRIAVLSDSSLIAFALVAMKPGETVDVGTIDVKPAERISGIVLDDRGRPVEGARVGIFATAAQLLSNASRGRDAITDVHGRFSTTAIGGAQHVHARLGYSYGIADVESGETIIRMRSR